MSTTNETAPGGTELQNQAMGRGWRIATAIVRILLGLMFFAFGLNFFVPFMPTPKEVPPEIMNVSGALMKAGYMTVVSAVEMLVAVMLLTNRFVPLALTLLAPIIVGIITFHVAMQPATIGPGIVVLAMELFLAWSYRGAFCPMLRAKVSPGAN